MTRSEPPAQTQPEPYRSSTPVYGSDSFMTVAQMIRSWAAPRALRSGVVVGIGFDPTTQKRPFSPREPRSWGQAVTAPLMIDEDTGDAPHVVRVGGTGAGKTACIISDGCTFRGSMVFLDPAVEIAPMLARERMRKGHRAVVMAVTHEDAQLLSQIDGLEIGGCNVLAHIPTDDPEEAEILASGVTESICGYTPEWSGNHAYFTQQGKDLVLCLLADLVCATDLLPHLRNLISLRMMLSDPELGKRLERIHVDSPSAIAREWAGELLFCSAKGPETWNSIYTTANAQTRWISFGPYGRLVSGDTFRPDDITYGDTDVFACIPVDTMTATPALARCIIGSLLSAVRRANGTNDWVAFEIEEADLLQRLREIEIAINTGRKYREKLLLHYQAISQIKRQFGEDGLDKLFQSLSFMSFMKVKDLGTAKYLQDRCGSYGAIRWSQSESTSGRYGQWLRSWARNTNLSEVEVPVQRSGATLTMPANAQIVISEHGKGICGVPYYYVRPEFRGRVDHNRFIREPQDGEYRRTQERLEQLLAEPDGETADARSRAATSDGAESLATPAPTPSAGD